MPRPSSAASAAVPGGPRPGPAVRGGALSPASAASAGRRKSPLRVASFPGGSRSPRPGLRSLPPGHRAGMTGEQLRAMQVSEFCQWLRSRTNQEKRPFQEQTITACKVAARALGAWMTTSGIDGDFTDCDAGMLNRFFRDYRAAHGQGGTNTEQRNLRHLLTWLEAEYDHPHPYTDALNRYAPVTASAPQIPPQSASTRS
jgi:integrase/recombinase XerD